MALMAGPEDNHANEIIQREDLTVGLINKLADNIFHGIENVDALIEEAHKDENIMLFEQNLIRSSSDLTATARNADAASLQILLHLQGHGATTKDIDGYRGTDTNDAAEAWAQQHMENTHSGSVDFTNSIPKDVLRAIALFNRQERFAKVMKIEDNTMLASNADMKLMENADKAKEYLQEKLAADTGGNLTLGKKISAMALAVQILLKQAGNNPQGLDGHVGGKTLAAAKAFADEYNQTAAEEDKISWNGGWPIPNAVLKRLAQTTVVPQVPVAESAVPAAATATEHADFPNAPTDLIGLIKNANLTKDDITFSADGKLESVSMYVNTSNGIPLIKALAEAGVGFNNPFGQNIDDINRFSWSREKGLYEISLSGLGDAFPEDIDITNLEYLSTYNNLPDTFIAPKLKILYIRSPMRWPTTLKVPSLEQLYANDITTLPDSIDQSKLTHLRISVTEFPTGLKLENIKDLRLNKVTSVPNNFHAPKLTHLFLFSIEEFPGNLDAPMLKTLSVNNLKSLPDGNYKTSLTRLGARSLVDPVQLSDFPSVTGFRLSSLNEMLLITEDSFLGDMYDKPTKISINAQNRNQYQYVGGRIEKISAENERLFAINVMLKGFREPEEYTIYQAEKIDVFHADLMEITDGDSQDAVARKKVEHVISKAENTQPSGNEKFLEYLFQFLLGANVRESVTPAESANAASALAQLENSDNQLTPESTNALAGYYFRKGDFAKAEEYANLTIQRARALGNTDQSAALQENSHQILAQLSSVPRFEAGETTNIFDSVTTLDVDLEEEDISGASIPPEYIEGSDVKYEELQEALLGRFGLDSGEIESTIFNAELEERTLEVMKRIATPAFQQIFSQYAVDGDRGTAWAEVSLLAGRSPEASASTMTSDEEANIATSIINMNKENLLELVETTRMMEGIRNLVQIEEASRNIALRELIDEHLGHVLDALPSALAHPSALDAENASGFNDLALFFAEKEILDPHQSARELFLLLADYRADVPRDREDMLVADTGNIFKKALEAFTNQNPAAAAALLQAESYEQLFGTPPTEDAVTPAEPRQPEEIGGSPADHQKYINKARGHALQQLGIVQEVVDGFVTGMFDGVPGDVNDKAEDAFTAMIARLEDTENHPNYVLDIPFGASIDAVAKPEDPQNAAIEANWEQEKHILGIRVSSEVDTNQFGSKLMGAIHGTQNSTDWDFGVDNISGTNEYLISVKTDGKLRTALQESGANPATWELALREILRAGMQHTQIEGEFFNPRTAHRRGMEAFEQQEKNEEMEQLRISERFLRNHEARASSLEINGETINTFAIERNANGHKYYVHIAATSNHDWPENRRVPGAFAEGDKVFIERVNQNGSRSIVYEKREIQKVLQLRAGAESSTEGLVAMGRFEESGQRVGEYHADHLKIDGENIPTAKYTYKEGGQTYLLHIANATRTSDHQSARINPAAGFSDSDQYQVFLTRQSPESGGHDHVLPLITDALLIERATRAVEQHLSGEAEAEEERTADFLDLFHHHSSQYEKAKEPDPTDGTATEFQHAIFEEINTSFAEINGTDYFVLDLEEAPSDIRVHLENAFQKDNKLYVPITGNKIPPVVVVTEDLPGGYKHEFLAVGDGKRPQTLVEAHGNVEPTASLKTAPLVRHVHIAGQTAPDRVEASSAE